MEQETFLERYRICKSEAGREVSRTGAAINYKATDTRSHEPVRLQLIPLATIEPEKLTQLKERAETAEKLDHVNIAKTLAVGVDHDYFVIVSEYFAGETADAWIVENGPMAADAALRVGLQIVRALGAAAYFNLTHRAIQPSNLVIAPGESPDGGWPFVKLLNFGLAGLELHSDSEEARELAPTISPQFASPEQRAGGEIDFRSEMYSLGATMCFLLTGAAPLAVSGMKARLRIQRLPELRRAPKPLHNLLVFLLRENPENRPQDPVALEKQMRECLSKIERRQAIGRKLGLPLAAVVPRKPAEKESASPIKQVFAGFAAVAVLLLGGAAAAEYFFPDKIPFFHRGGKVGVQIGVPDTAKFASASTSPANPSSAPANQPVQDSSTANVDQSQTTTAPAVAAPAVANNETASASAAESPGPAVASTDRSSAAATENFDQSSSAEGDESAERSKKKAVGSNRKSTYNRGGQGERFSPYEENIDHGSAYPPRRHVARVVGRTADGRLIVRLSSGRVVVLPRANEDNIYLPRQRHRAYVEPEDDGFVPPAQPFNPSN
jgi:serine/threonine protein kinase